MRTNPRLNDQSLETVERNHSQFLEEIRREHKDELQKLITDYEEQLQEEKEATRQALDALQKAHEMEMHRQVQKVRDEQQQQCSCIMPKLLNSEDWSRKKSHDFRDMLERMNKEVYELSAAYSAKCLENSVLEDELEEARQILERISKSSATDVADNMCAILIEMKRAKLSQTKLSVTEAELNASKQKIIQLEANCSQNSQSRCSSNDIERNSPKPSTSVKPVTVETRRNIDSLDCEEETYGLAEYTPKGSRVRRMSSRRNDSRYYSSPNLDRTEDLNSNSVRRRSLTPDSVLIELRQAMGLPVCERRKFFENLGKQSSI